MSASLCNTNTNHQHSAPLLVLTEECERRVGAFVGKCKWFSNKLGYGFITVQGQGQLAGRDIFVHHSGVCPLNSNYKTLYKGEYVSLDICGGPHGLHAANVSGIGGGTLMCDVAPPPRALHQDHHNAPSRHQLIHRFQWRYTDRVA